MVGLQIIFFLHIDCVNFSIMYIMEWKKFLPPCGLLEVKMTEVICSNICYDRSPTNFAIKEARKWNDFEKNSHAFASFSLKVIYFPHLNISRVKLKYTFPFVFRFLLKSLFSKYISNLMPKGVSYESCPYKFRRSLLSSRIHIWTFFLNFLEKFPVQTKLQNCVF